MDFSWRAWLATAFALFACAWVSERACARDGDVVLPFGARLVIPPSGSFYPLGVCVDSANRVLLSGYRYVDPAPPGGKDYFAARLLPNGAADPDFGTAGQVQIPFDVAGGNDDIGTRCAMQGDKPVITGTVETTPAGFDFGLLRLDEDGTPDDGFGIDGELTVAIDDGGSTDLAVAILVQPDQKIVVAGEAYTATGNLAAVARLMPDGARDNAFDLDGRVSIAFAPGDPAEASFAESVAEDSLGRIIVAGASAHDFAIARLTPDGALDPTFNGSGTTTVAFDLAGDGIDQAEGVLAQSDGKIVAAGYACSGGTPGCSTEDVALVRLNADGSLDASFGQGGRRVISLDRGGSNVDRAYAILQQPDGKLLVIGTVTTSDTDADAFVLRLRADGSLDPGFGTNGVAIHGNDGFGDLADIPLSAVLLASGEIVIGGIAQFGAPPATYGFAMRIASGDDIFTDGLDPPL